MRVGYVRPFSLNVDTDGACGKYSNKRRRYLGRETSGGLFWNLSFLATLLLTY